MKESKNPELVRDAFITTNMAKLVENFNKSIYGTLEDNKFTLLKGLEYLDRLAEIYSGMECFGIFEYKVIINKLLKDNFTAINSEDWDKFSKFWLEQSRRLSGEVVHNSFDWSTE